MKIRFIDKLSGNLLYILSRMVGKTCRYQTFGFENYKKAFSSGSPVIIACWHGLTLAAASFISKIEEPSSFVCLMPDDWRGASLLVFAEKFGAIPHPMNLEGEDPMGQGRQLVKLVRRVVGGKHLVINPDGPSGPSQVIKPGVTYIAKKADAVILPVGAYARCAYTMPRWDRYLVPFPFSRVSFHIDEPIKIPPDVELADFDSHLTNILNRVTLQAAANYYELN